MVFLGVALMMVYAISVKVNLVQHFRLVGYTQKLMELEVDMGYFFFCLAWSNWRRFHR